MITAVNKDFAVGEPILQQRSNLLEKLILLLYLDEYPKNNKKWLTG